MNRVLIFTALMAALASGAAFAQSATPGSADPSTPQSQPQTQTLAQPEAQPQSQPETRPAPPTMQAPAASQPSTGQASASQAQPAGGTRIAPGSVIPVQLTKTIDAKKAKVGDPVMAKVTMDLKTNSGEVIVPKDTKVTDMSPKRKPVAKIRKSLKSQLPSIMRR